MPTFLFCELLKNPLSLPNAHMQSPTSHSNPVLPKAKGGNCPASSSVEEGAPTQIRGGNWPASSSAEKGAPMQSTASRQGRTEIQKGPNMDSKIRDHGFEMFMQEKNQIQKIMARVQLRYKKTLLVCLFVPACLFDFLSRF